MSSSCSVVFSVSSQQSLLISLPYFSIASCFNISGIISCVCVCVCVRGCVCVMGCITVQGLFQCHNLNSMDTKLIKRDISNGVRIKVFGHTMGAEKINDKLWVRQNKILD